MISVNKEKMFFIIKKHKWSWGTQYFVHDHKMYDLTNSVRKLLALDTLNEDKATTSYHLQEVSFSEVQEPLVLTRDMEVKEDKQQELF